MSAISASMVKDLRDKTGAGMMDCKKALAESNGDLEGAVKILREKGIAKGQKRAGRTAAEGLVAYEMNDNATAAAIVELNSETDFVARNDEFKATVDSMAKTALKEKTNSPEALEPKTLIGIGKTAKEVVDDLVARIGEKIVMNRVAYVEADVICGYIHPPGKIGVLIAAKLDGAKATDGVKDALRGVAMHVASTAPRFITRDEVDQTLLDAEAEIFGNIARKEGKPENIIPKIVEGKLKSYYKDNCLLEQEHVMHSKKTVSQVIEEEAKKAGGKVNVTQVVRFHVGEKSGTEEGEAAEE